MVLEQSRRLWHTTPKEVKRKRGYYDPNYLMAGATGGAGIGAMLGGPPGAAVGLAMGAIGGGIAGFFGKKPKRDVADPLAGLRAQLQALAGQVPAQVAKQKELAAARYAQARTEGIQGIRENVRAERGFGASSIEDRLRSELIDKLTKSQAESELASDIWGTKTQADILSGTASMYPGAPEEEQPSWQSNLLGAGANLAVQNWMQEQQWKNLAKYFGGDFGGGMSGSRGVGKALPGLSEGLLDIGSKYLMFS